MRILFRISFIFLLISFSCSGTKISGSFSEEQTAVQLNTTDDLYRFLTYGDNRYPLVSAHRGGPAAGFPENALETFENSAAIQPLVIECDVAMSKDSVLVLMHDDKLDRTTTGRGLLSRFTLEELKALYLIDNDGKETSYRIPTLQEALKWGMGKVLFTLDIKRGVPYKRVIEVIRKNRAEAYSVVITYNAGQAAEVHRLAPDLMISASVGSADELLRLNEYGVPDNRLIAFVGTSEPDSEVYKLLHNHGIMCILGTMGNLDKRAAARGDELYYDLIARGADILSTDRPVETGAQLLQYRLDKKLTSEFIR